MQDLFDTRDLIIAGSTTLVLAVATYLFVTFPRPISTGIMIAPVDGRLALNEHGVTLRGNDAYRYMHAMVIQGEHKDMRLCSMNTNYPGMYIENAEQAYAFIKQKRDARFGTAAWPWRALSWLGF